MAKQYMVLTAIGPDRPGIVKEISAVIHNAGANLEDSRMAILANEFALLALFSGAADTIQRVQQDCRALEQRLDFTIGFKPTTERVAQEQESLFELEVTGVDQAGIVHRVSEVLASHQVNVVSLESRLSRAAFSGTPVFHLQAELQIPHQPALAELNHKLEEVCERLNLSFQLAPQVKGT